MIRLDGINLFIRSPYPAESVQADGSEVRYTDDRFGVVVQNLNAAIEELRGKGVKILQEPRTARPGTRVAFIEGPDHTRIEVLQRDDPVGARARHQRREHLVERQGGPQERCSAGNDRRFDRLIASVVRQPSIVAVGCLPLQATADGATRDTPPYRVDETG
jgi:hypothetical protein